MSLTELDFNYKYFLDRTTVMYGESGTGKSFVIVDILHHLKAHVEQIIVISPTDRQNRTYSRGLVPLPCIHYDITDQLLDDIWQRQNAFCGAYSKANEPEVLLSLFNKVGRSYEKTAIGSINRKLADYKEEVQRDIDDESVVKTKIAEMEADCKRLILLIFKHAINENREALSKMSLTKEENYSLKYLNLNPRLVLIFDDCTDLLTKFRKHRVIKKLFYQGRWAFITALIACHTDKALDPELKKNAFISMYTEETCARSFFERKSNDLDKEARGRSAMACKSAFTPMAKHQKLAWVREEKKFYRFTATARPSFRFGSQYLWDFCDQIQADSNTIASDNRFAGSFA